MTDTLLHVGFETLQMFLCIFLPVKLTGGVEEKTAGWKKILSFVICILVIGSNGRERRNLYYNGAIWVMTDICALLVFLLIKKKKTLVCTGIAILINHVLIYIDYVVGFLFVIYGSANYTEMAVAHGKYPEIKVIHLLIRLILVVGVTIGTSRRKVRLEDLRYSRLIFIILDIFSYVLLVFFQAQFLNGTVNVQLNYALIVLAMAAVFCAILIVYMKHANQKEQKRQMELRNDLLENNYRQLYAEQKQLERTAHDFKNHVNVLEKYLKEECYSEAIDYISALKAPLETIYQRNWSGSRMLDTILNNKFAEADQQGIRLYPEIEVTGCIPLTEYDLCVVLSNLLDNAIEACRYVEEGEKELYVSVKTVNQFFLIKIVNSIGNEPKQENGVYVTTKKDPQKHGIGLESVRASLEKYQGTLALEHTEEKFTAVVSIWCGEQENLQ